MNRALVRRAIEANLGAGPEILFRDFSETPFAAASLGQVHLAPPREDGRIALKLQYPGIARTVRNDLAVVADSLRRCPGSKRSNRRGPRSPNAWWRSSPTWKRRVGRNGSAKCGPPGVVIPRVLPEFGSDTVLATEFMEGEHLAEWLPMGLPRPTGMRWRRCSGRCSCRSVYEIGRSTPTPTRATS